MNSLKKWLLLCASLVTSATYAETLDELFAKALENDNQLEILRLSETNTRLGIEKRDLPKRIQIKASTDDVGISFVQVLGESPATSVTLDPGVTVTLPENIETSIGVSTDLNLGLDEAEEFSFKPVFSVSHMIRP